jgi:Uma2 family endonuclease
MAMPGLKRRWTVADRDELPDDGRRYEVIDGELFVTPAPRLEHQRASLELCVLLYEYLARSADAEVFAAPADVVFSPQRAVQPDVFVVPRMGGKRIERFEDIGRLLLAVEILSPGTARTDRVAKRLLYRSEGVDEYWIVDLESRTFERSTPADPRVEILADQVRWQPDGAIEPLAIDLVAYIARVLGD